MIDYLRWISFSFVIALLAPSISQAEEAALQTTSGYSLLVKVMVALAVVLTLFVLLMWVLRRLQGINAPHSGDMEIDQRLPLDARHAVLVLKRGSRRWLVGLSNDGIKPLDTWREDAVEIEEKAP